MMDYGQFLGFEGIRLYWQRWLPKTEKIKAVVVFMHGGNNYSSLPYIQNIADKLTDAGYALYAYDQRGFGRSEGIRMHMDRWEQVRADMKAFLHLVKKNHPDLPVYAFGVSFGAAQTFDQAIVSPFLLDGIIIGGFSLIPLDVPMKSLLMLLGKLFPRVKMPADVPESFPGAKEKMQGTDLWKDPLCPETMTFGNFTVLITRQASYQDECQFVSLPVLHLQGAQDTIAKPDPSLITKLASEDVTYKVYDNANHDLFNSPDADKIVVDVIRWLDDRT